MPITLFYYLSFTGIYILLGWAIYMPFRNGQLDNMPVATMAVGAYVAAYLTKDLGWPFSIAIFIAMGAGALYAFIIGLGLARAPAFSTTIATIAMVYITMTVLRNMQFLGGVYGLYGIPRVKHLLIVIWVIVVIVGIFVYRLDHSRTGRAMEVVFIDKDLGTSLGTRTYWLSVWLQTFAGVIGAIAGVLYANVMRMLVPRHFSFALLLNVYCFLFVGGASTMWGIVLLAPVLWAFPVVLPEDIAAWKDFIYGSLLICAMLFVPEGLITKKVLRNLKLSFRNFFRRLFKFNKVPETEKGQL
jgi:branched-chain amino acid transport system permease protein